MAIDDIEGLHQELYSRLKLEKTNEKGVYSGVLELEDRNIKVTYEYDKNRGEVYEQISISLPHLEGLDLSIDEIDDEFEVSLRVDIYSVLPRYLEYLKNGVGYDHIVSELEKISCEEKMEFRSNSSTIAEISYRIDKQSVVEDLIYLLSFSNN